MGMRSAGELGMERGEAARKQVWGRGRKAGEQSGETPGGGRRGFPRSLLALLPGLWRRETCGRCECGGGEWSAPLGPRRGEPLPRGAQPLLSLPPAAPRAGRLLGAHHHVHQLVAHVRRHRRRRWPPGAAAAAAAAASGGGAQPPAGTGPAPPGAPRRGRSPGGLHQRPGAQGEPPLAQPGPRGSRGPRAAASSQGSTDRAPTELSFLPSVRRRGPAQGHGVPWWLGVRGGFAALVPGPGCMD